MACTSTTGAPCDAKREEGGSSRAVGLAFEEDTAIGLEDAVSRVGRCVHEVDFSSRDCGVQAAKKQPLKATSWIRPECRAST